MPVIKESSSIVTVDEMEHFAIDSARQLEVIVFSPGNDTFIALAIDLLLLALILYYRHMVSIVCNLL